MSLDIEIKKLSERIKDLKTKVLTEEATKHSFIMPFLNVLGYDIFDPTVVVPEFIADIGIKKGEKVDYAIFYNNKPLMVIEAKNHTEKLDNHNNQLIRYFNVTDSKFAILTNGIEYRFFSDLEEPNKMDQNPFLVINLENLRERDIKELSRFTKDNLDIDSILSMASVKRYHREIQDIFKNEIENPSDDFVKVFARKLTDKSMTTQVIEEFRGHIKKSFNEILNDLANDKILAMQSNLQSTDDNEELYNNKITTTDEELEGYYIVRSILSEYIDPREITFKDTMSYFAIILNGMVTKWICRLHLNGNKKVVFQDEEMPIEHIEDIYKLKGKLKLSLDSRLK